MRVKYAQISRRHPQFCDQCVLVCLRSHRLNSQEKKTGLYPFQLRASLLPGDSNFGVRRKVSYRDVGHCTLVINSKPLPAACLFGGCETDA